MKYIFPLLLSLAVLALFPASPRAADAVAGEGQGTGAEKDPSAGFSSAPLTLQELGKKLNAPLEKPRFPWDSYPIYDLDTSELELFPYFVGFKRRVEEEWVYPIDSQLGREEGKLTMLVAISRDGRVEDVLVIEPSAHERLNEEAARAVRAAEPFPRFPSDWGLEGIRIRARFSYVIDHSLERGVGTGAAMRDGTSNHAPDYAPSYVEVRKAILGKFERRTTLSRARFGVDSLPRP